MRDIEQAQLRTRGTGERTARVTEQLRLDELARQSRAIDIDEGFLGAGAVVVEPVREHTFTRACLTLDQHRGMTIQNLMRVLGEALNRRTLSYERVDPTAMLEDVDRDRSTPRPLRFDQVANHYKQRRKIQRTCHVVRRARPHGIVSITHEDEWDALVDSLQMIGAFERGIDDREIRRRRSHLVGCILDGAHVIDDVSVPAQI
jgi:hypothetical protein